METQLGKTFSESFKHGHLQLMAAGLIASALIPVAVARTIARTSHITDHTAGLAGKFSGPDLGLVSGFTNAVPHLESLVTKRARNLHKGEDIGVDPKTGELRLVVDPQQSLNLSKLSH